MRPLLPKGSITLLICVALIFGSSLGCRRLADLANRKTADDAPPTRSTPSDADAVGEDGSLVKKSNLYITECFNKYSNSVVSSYNRYQSWVKDIDAGPTGKETLVYGLYDVTGDGSDCEKAVADAKAMDPELPELEETADKYAASLKEVVAKIHEVYNYYEQEDYKDDAFAKGKAVHPGLIAAFKDFKDVNTTFSSQVDQLEDRVANEELAKLRAESGNEYEALVVESGIKAKAIKNLLQEKEYEQLTADELTPLIEDFDKTVETMRTTTTKKVMADSYVRACDEFTKASKEMMRRIRDGKKFNESERRFIAMGSGWMVDGSPGKVIKAYNDMIMQRRFTRF
ncbi:MAG: YiiG family protein [Pyrinomonadaceae bacterium]